MRASSAMRVRRAPSFGGRKPSKKNRSVGRPATASAASAADGPGTAVTGKSGLAGRAHQLEARIGNERRAGVGHQRDRLARGEPRQELRPRRRGVVLVVGRQRRRDAVVVEQLPRDPRVLAGDQVGRGEGLQRPQRDVAQVADRGGDEVQPGGEPRRLDRLPGQDIRPGAILGAVLGPVLAGFSGMAAVYRPARVASSPWNVPETAPETDLYPFHLVNLSSSLCLFANVDWHCRSLLLSRTSSMIPASQAPMHSLPRRAFVRAAALLAGALAILAGCSGISEVFNKNPAPGAPAPPVQSS